MKQIQAMVEAGIDFRAEKVFEAIDPSIIRDVNCVCEIRIRGQTRVFKHTAVENEFKHKRVGSVPAVGVVVRLLA